ncbi:MAG: molybdenum cofactor biosynthesis protein A [Syntrophorhabdaceae bacterium PtaU1.Bin034]|nr:MAG: molybdenum cofactor biosynthesis protein A [Syntrophorhabdaceae bacterium PtaU1.Bin034]
MRCDYCERRCQIRPGKTGFCRMYTADEGGIKERFPHRWSSYGASRMESIPFYHAYPGSRSLIIGTSSCNFRCRYCSNAHIAKEDPALLQGRMFHLSPGEVVGMARKLECQNIVFSVNEPTVSLPTLLETAEEAKAAGLPMGCLTNAYTTERSTEMLESVFSFFNISLKGLSADFMEHYIGIPSSVPVLRNIRKLAGRNHVEITTPIIQFANDNELDEIADFIARIDPEIPWHVFRLLPEDEMKGTEYPSIDAINQALQSAREKLPYVYFHNFVGSEWVNTLCPDCGTPVIERFSLGCGGDKLQRFLCRGKTCPKCHRTIRLWGEESTRSARTVNA